MVFLFATLSKAYLLTSQLGNFWCVVYIYYKECLSERCSFLSDKMS